MMAIAIMCAMPMELRAVRRHLRDRDGVITGLLGVGTARARDRTERLLDEHAVDHVMVVGISGAVDDVTPLASVVVPAVVIDAASGREYRAAPLPGVAAEGALWTTDRLTTGEEAMVPLRARGVVALDMETAGVAAVCDRRDVPWSVVRAYSDRATDPAIDAELVGLMADDGRGRPGAALWLVARRPGRIRDLVRLARSSWRAAHVAARAAARAIEEVRV